MFTATFKLFYRSLYVALFAFVPLAHAFDYEDLVELITRDDLTTIEQVVSRLPGEYRDSYALGFHSRSLHSSSYESPRAILFGRNAKLIITFNGDPGQQKYRELEIMQFREESNEFEMRSISFEREVRFSQKNPSVCLTCHGNSPRPIWSSYEYSEIDHVQHWPGFYGSTHDAPLLNADEKEAYMQFRTLAANHPRYGLLRLDHPDTAWYPFGVGPNKHQFRPNNRLGNLLARLNAKRVAHQLTSGKFFARYPNVTLLWLLQCPQAEDDAFLGFIKRSYDREFAVLSHIDLDQYTARSVEQVAFVFEKLLSGLDVYTWNLKLEPGPNDERFFTGIVDIDELAAAAVLERLPSDHWLREYYISWDQQQLYDTFRQDYYAANVAPGGVGDSYNELGRFFDREHAKRACPALHGHALREMAGTEG